MLPINILYLVDNDPPVRTRIAVQTRIIYVNGAVAPSRDMMGRHYAS